jgi:hypothetical protein
VPEQYQCTRTVYRTESHQEAYTAYRCEYSTESRTRTCTTYKMVPEVRTITRTECVCVPSVEQRTVMTTHVSYKPVTTTCRRCVDRGHYECCEVPCGPSFGERLRGLCHRHKHCGCEDECNECAPVRTKTVKRWVPCKVWEEYPVTTCQRVCESVPVTCNVTVYHTQTRQVPCQVTCMKCVPESHVETYTVCVPHQVAYQATRTVCVCVPHQETYTATRMVARTVTKEVPVTTCAASPCAAEASCCSSGCGRKHHFRFSGFSFGHHHKGCGCESGCDSGCGCN